MVVFPILACFISAAFSVLVLRQFARRKRTYQLAWGVALAEFAVATLAVALAVGGDGWDPTLYRLYWLFGALLTVPWLALGSVALLRDRALTAGGAAGVAVGTGWAFYKVFSTGVNPSIVGDRDIPLGRVAWLGHGDIRWLAQWYSIPAYFLVVGIAVWTSRRRAGVAPPRERVRANLLIALGVTIVAIGSTALERLAEGAAFSVTLAVGVIVMFAGLLLASRPPRRRVQEPGESPT
ncbi:MAG: hypothetical protein ABR552_06895 [Actinomycetota bacterium]